MIPDSRVERMGLYRFFDAAGVLLYVGISNSPSRRFTEHAADKPWWHEVERVEIDWLRCPRYEAEAEEAVAIWWECPKYNVDSPILRRYRPRPGPRAFDTIELYDSMSALFEGIQTLYETEGVR